MRRGSLTAYIYDSLDHFGRCKMLRDLRAERQVYRSPGIRKINRRAWNAVHLAKVKSERAAQINYEKHL